MGSVGLLFAIVPNEKVGNKKEICFCSNGHFWPECDENKTTQNKVPTYTPPGQGASASKRQSATKTPTELVKVFTATGKGVSGSEGELDEGNR